MRKYESLDDLNKNFFFAMQYDGADLGVAFDENGFNRQMWIETMLSFETMDEALEVAVHWLRWIAEEEPKDEMV